MDEHSSQVTDQTPVANQPKHTAKKSPIILIIGVIILVLLFMGIGYVLGSKHSESPSDNMAKQRVTPVTTGDTSQRSITNWKTYKTQDFSFQYPPDGSVRNVHLYNVLDWKDVNGFRIQSGTQQSDGYDIQLAVIKHIQGNSPDDFLKTLTNYQKDTVKPYINGAISGVSFKNTVNSQNFLTVLEVKDHTAIVLQQVTTSAEEVTAHDSELFNTFVSTFVPVSNMPDDPKIQNEISFTLPQGWKQHLENTNISGYPGDLVIESPDLVDNPTGYPIQNPPGLRVMISYSLDGSVTTVDDGYNEIYNEIHDPHPASAVPDTLTKTTVAGYPAISWYYNFEGHEHTYNVYEGNRVWTIVIGSSEEKTETDYHKELTSILSSIKFLPMR